MGGEHRARLAAGALLGTTLLLAACGSARPLPAPAPYTRPLALPTRAFASAGTQASAVPQGSNLLAGGSPVIAMNTPDGTGVSLQPQGQGYQVVFGANVAQVSNVPAEGDWVAYILPQLQRGQRYVFTVNVRGQGSAYMDVWDGGTDLASPVAQLTSKPQVLSMTVTLPTFGLSPGNSTPELQVRTHTFPTTVLFTAGVYVASGGSQR